MSDKIFSYIILIVVTIISGLADGYGFSNATKMWSHPFNWQATFRSGLGFFLGMLSFWLASKYMKEIGISSTELQTIIWFAFTIIGIAIFSGTFFAWPAFDKILGIGIVVSLAVLIFRIGA